MSRYVVQATWDDAVHLSEKEKQELWNSIPEYQRAARAKGIPTLGSGLVYPFPETTFLVDPLQIPKHWPRCFGLDTDAGAGFTAILWAAWDRDTNTVYVYRDYKSPSREKALHIDALKQQGIWMPGVGDARALMVTEHDSQQVIELYRAAGIDIDHPDKAVEAGIQSVYDLLTARQLKIFRNCQDLLSEMRQYHRKDGRINKTNDHCCDALRYLIFSGLKRAIVQPEPPKDPVVSTYTQGESSTGWMQM